MGNINTYMKELVESNSVGFYATIDKSGLPCVSPKGTSVVLDEETILFGNIRSPNTISNIKLNPAMEVNFLDVLSRRGFRARGKAHYIERDSNEFDQMISSFSKWDSLIDRFKGIVVLKVSSAQGLKSPVYDIGCTEEESYGINGKNIIRISKSCQMGFYANLSSR